jgi:ubiquitin carboxyl-terminal hydrolase 7
MGTEFIEFPSTLQLDLRLLEFDYNSNMKAKNNDRFQFPPTINLAQFLTKDVGSARATVFDVYGVLVHNGGAHGGHYSAFLRSSTADEGLEFNDTRVSHITAARAIA